LGTISFNRIPMPQLHVTLILRLATWKERNAYACSKDFQSNVKLVSLQAEWHKGAARTWVVNSP